MINTTTRSRTPAGRLGRLLGLALTPLLAAALLVGSAGPAAAHPNDGLSTDEAHAAADLVGVPVAQIERETAANAAKIAAVTGVRPGEPTRKALSTKTERVAAKVEDDPTVGGKWSGVFDTPVVPVFQALLPNGKVLMWDSVGDGATEGYPYPQNFTRVTLWTPNDPVADPDGGGTSEDTRNNPAYNLFCAGYVQLANGNVLVAGGNKDTTLAGIVQTHLYDWVTNSWSRGPDMAAGRWYPSVAALANGEALILGGGPSVAEVYQANGTLRSQTGYSTPSNRLYPFLVPRTDTQVEYMGPQNYMFTIDTSGAGKITSNRNRDGLTREYGSFATFGIGKTLVTGGATAYKNGGRVPTDTAVVLNTNGTTSKVDVAKMSGPRSQHTLTVLPDGTVLSTGGMTAFEDNDYVNLNAAVLAAERYDPVKNTWTTLAPAARVRQYHSAALLLPDGRVMTGGGGVCGVCVTKGYLEKNVQYFSPPYLFTKDADGNAVPADRPVIDRSTPSSVSYNTSFTLKTTKASSIRKVSLNRLGAPTHSEDQGQRYVPLEYSYDSATDTLKVTTPPNGGIAPPGYYQLTVVDAAGVPSVAKIVQVVAGSTPQATGIRLADVVPQTCIDPNNGVVTSGTRPRLWTCNGTPAQQWTPQPVTTTAQTDDVSLRTKGACMDITKNVRKAGTAIQFWTCKSTDNDAQRWVRGADQTIRSAATPTLCLTTVGSATAIRTELELQPCDGRAGQRWKW